MGLWSLVLVRCFDFQNPHTIKGSAKSRYIKQRPKAEDQRPRAKDRSLLRIRDREIALFAAHKQTGQAARRRDLDFDVMPLAVTDKVRRAVADRILMAQLERDLLEDVVHLCGAARIEGFAARHGRQFVQDTLAFHAQRAADIAAA